MLIIVINISDEFLIKMLLESWFDFTRIGLIILKWCFKIVRL